MRDFTVKKYKALIRVLLNEGYKTLSVEQAILLSDVREAEKIAIIRHDIDTRFDLPIAIEMATFENKNNVTASYYFRSVPETFHTGTIEQIRDLGHEIGYHYEVMSLAKGNEAEAMKRFKRDLEELRRICEIKTICQHGGAMGHYNTTSLSGLMEIGWDYLRGKIRRIEYYPSINLWEKYRLKDYGLVGDAYLSLDFSIFKYFSDTGQRWDSHETRILDNIQESQNYSEITARDTNDLIDLIRSEKIRFINLLVHPANWNDPYFPWLKWRILQKVRNNLKKLYNPNVHS
ncbi:MAG: hypothetical protein JW737_03290 [Acidobacteria bacterium]|nr:hypothetical protein [Acidobacteriota bacterium]